MFKKSDLFDKYLTSNISILLTISWYKSLHFLLITANINKKLQLSTNLLYCIYRNYATISYNLLQL